MSYVAPRRGYVVCYIAVENFFKIVVALDSIHGMINSVERDERNSRHHLGDMTPDTSNG